MIQQHKSPKAQAFAQRQVLYRGNRRNASALSASFLPADYVDRTNLVRAIDAYGDAVDPTPSNSSANWLLSLKRTFPGRDLIRRAPALPRPKEPES